MIQRSDLASKKAAGDQPDPKQQDSDRTAAEPPPAASPGADAPGSPSSGVPDSGLVGQLEALLFTARDPLLVRRLAELTGDDADAVRAALVFLQTRYSGECGVHLVEIGGGFRLLTNPDCVQAVAALHGKKARDRLSPAALETLAIVAYKQPISRAEIERVRGVGVGPVLRHLLEIDLIKVAGREESLGRALLYATTRSFLDRFGLKNVKDLPASLEL